MAWNIKLKCKCGSVLISSPPWPNITPAKQVARTRSVVFLHSDWQRAEDPEERSQSKMWMMTLDFLWWTRLRWILRVCRGRLWGNGGGQDGRTSSRSAPHYCAISNFLRRDVWTATCELVVKADKQTQLKVRSLRISLFILHKYLSDCMCPCSVFFTSTSTCLYTHTEKRIRLHIVVEWSSLSYKATCCCFWASCQDNMTGAEVCGKLT